MGGSTESRDKSSIEASDESLNSISSKEEAMKTEVATVQNIVEDTIILQNSAGETYHIPDASRFKLSIEKNQSLVFSYTEKTLSEEGYYVLTVKWIGDWSSLDQNNFANGS